MSEDPRLLDEDSCDELPFDDDDDVILVGESPGDYLEDVPSEYDVATVVESR